jgi:hypothetical protein
MNPNDRWKWNTISRSRHIILDPIILKLILYKVPVGVNHLITTASYVDIFDAAARDCWYLRETSV